DFSFFSPFSPFAFFAFFFCFLPSSAPSPSSSALRPANAAIQHQCAHSPHHTAHNPLARRTVSVVQRGEHGVKGHGGAAPADVARLVVHGAEAEAVCALGELDGGGLALEVAAQALALRPAEL